MAAPADRTVILEPGLPFPGYRRVLVLGPHPDDFDAIAVTLRQAQAAGAVLRLAVLTTGGSGVDPADYPDLDREGRIALREAEQRASCARFGLPTDAVRFLRLDARTGGELAEDEPNRAQLDALLTEWLPDLICLPHPDDPNLAHQRTFALARTAVARTGRPIPALLNRDPKTRALRSDLAVRFGEEAAEWKRGLLRLHASQQRRNLRTRNAGLDDRILGMNSTDAAALGVPGYAEVFERREDIGGV
jgi:LmbE family N-acetylglucosaminyl deacetylase